MDDCLIPCACDKTQACGGTWRIAVYRNPQYMQVSTSRKTMCFQTTTKILKFDVFLLTYRLHVGLYIHILRTLNLHQNSQKGQSIRYCTNVS